MQHRTQRPIQLEITPAARDAVQKWIKTAGPRADKFVLPSRIQGSPRLRRRQYARIFEGWSRSLVNRMSVLVHDGIGVWLAARRLNRSMLGLPWQRIGEAGVIRLL